MRWKFPTGNARDAEKRVAAKLRTADKLYKFLFEVRDELFDDEFQSTLIAA